MEGSIGELIGREREQATIEDALERAHACTTVLVLEGEPGVGKTTLWRLGVERATAGGFQVLATQPAEAEAKLTYAGLADLLTPYVDAIGALPGPQRRSLRVALRLEEIQAVQPDETAVALATRNLLRMLALDAPLLLAVDDMQWLDAASADVLAFVLRRLRDEPVAALLTVRGGTPRPQFDHERIVVTGLDAHDLGRLLRTRLNTSFAPPVVERIRDACGGNPFFALEIGRELAEGRISVRPAEPLPLPSTLRTLLEGRIARVSPAARSMLVIVAAAATIREATLVECLGSEAQSAIREAVTAELLVRHGEELRFSHPLLRSTVYDLAPVSDRREAHRALAHSATDAEARARHLALATDRPDAATAEAVEAAARSAAERGAFVAAADLAEQATGLTPPDERDSMWRRLVLAGEHHYRSGNFAAARTSVERAEQVAATEEQRSLTICAAGTIEAAAGSPARAAAAYRRALANTFLPDPARADIAVGLAYLVALTEPIDAAVAAAEEALALAERSGNPWLLSHALSRLALLETLRGGERRPDLMQRALDLEREQIAEGGLPEWDRVASVHFAEQLIELGEFDAARALLAEVCEICREYGVQMLAWPLGKRAALEQRAGNWDIALDPAGEAVEFAEEIGDAGRNYCRAIKAHVHAARGEAEDALRELDEARRHTRPEPDAPFVERVAGFAHLAAGEAAAAHECLSRATAGALTTVDRALCLPDQIEASVALGELERAASEAAELESVARTLDRPLVHAAAARCHGLVADARGAEGTLEAFERALTWHDDVGQRFERARTLLAYGVALRRAKRAGDARAALESARDLFDETASRPWAERARGELARLGGRPSQTRALTPTERRIAELVAAGKSNAEVARALHVSPKTVEWNLSKVYKKVRVSSRAELAATFARRSA